MVCLRAFKADFLPTCTTKVGDKVELIDGYEKFNDSTGGPLQAGDRGTVVDIQRGPNGER